MTMSLALTVTVGALVAAASQELAAARRDLVRSRAEYVLAGAHLQAALRLEDAAPGSRFRWTENTELGPAEVTAEVEQSKLSYRAGAELGGGLRTLGAADAEQARRVLLQSAGEKQPGVLVKAGLTSPCAASAISAFGESAHLTDNPAKAPQPSLGGQALLGQVWRVRINADGWADDRLVRFTGDGRRPAAVITRRLARGEPMGEKCDALLKTLAAG
jgi:hypothetical protein